MSDDNHIPVPPKPLATISLSEIEGVKNALCPKPDSEKETEDDLTKELEELSEKVNPLP